MIYFLAVSIILILVYESSILESLAESSPIDHQEILNKNNWTNVSSKETDVDIHDGRKFFFNSANRLSECTNSAIFSKLPNIESVSYVSNGKALNTTFWLDRPALINDYFQDPSRINDIHQVFVYIEKETLLPSKENIQNFTKDILDETETIENNYRDLNDVKKIEIKDVSNTTLSNNTAFEFEFNGTLNYSTLGHPQIKGKDIFTIKNETKYRILYFGDPLEYTKQLPNVSKMIKSFHIGIQPFDNITHNKISQFVFYNQNGIEIQYPEDWDYSVKKNPSRIIFFSPIHGPYLIGTGYLMSMDVPSAYNSPTDFVAKVMWWDSLYNRTWFKLLQEISVNGTTRTLEQLPNYTQSFENEQNHDRNTTFVFLPIDLSLFDSPAQYFMVFASEAKYINENGRLCDLIQISNQVSAPPPKFDITLSENSTSIGPPIQFFSPMTFTLPIYTYKEVKTIEIKIKSSAASTAFVTLSTSPEFIKRLGVTFSPSTLEIPASGWASTLLTLKSNTTEFTKDGSITQSLPIFADIKFKQGGGLFTFNTHQLQYTQAEGHKPEAISLSVTMLSLTDYLLNTIIAVSTPVNVVIASVGAIAGGVVWYLDRRSSCKQQQKKK